MPFDMVPVTNSESRNIRSAAFDKDSGVMRVEFASGKQWDYHNVSPEVYQAFLDSPSAGEYFHKVIKVGNPAAPVTE